MSTTPSNIISAKAFPESDHIVIFMDDYKCALDDYMAIVDFAENSGMTLPFRIAMFAERSSPDSTMVEFELLSEFLVGTHGDFETLRAVFRASFRQVIEEEHRHA